MEQREGTGRPGKHVREAASCFYLFIVSFGKVKEAQLAEGSGWRYVGALPAADSWSDSLLPSRRRSGSSNQSSVVKQTDNRGDD